MGQINIWQDNRHLLLFHQAVKRPTRLFYFRKAPILIRQWFYSLWMAPSRVSDYLRFSNAIYLSRFLSLYLDDKKLISIPDRICYLSLSIITIIKGVLIKEDISGHGKSENIFKYILLWQFYYYPAGNHRVVKNYTLSFLL